MTVIKAFNDDKKDIDIKPLVENAIPPSEDVEVGAGTETPQNDPHLLMMRVRAKRASTITTLLLIATSSLVLTFGIFGGFYIYKQFAQAKLHRFRTIYNVPYYDEEDRALSQRLTKESYLKGLNQIVNQGEEMVNEALETMDIGNRIAFPQKEFREEVELDLKSGAYEKIHVPEYERGFNSKYIHDFHLNMSAIIDLERRKCLVMPLNRSSVLPPASLLDLLQKMWSGYYVLNSTQISESYKAVEFPSEDIDTLGEFISHECSDFPVYKLEKYYGRIVKRSVDNVPNKAFTVLDGAQPRAINIVNIDNLEPVAVARK